MHLSERESSYVRALELLLAGRWTDDFYLARALANERCALKPTSRINQELLGRSQKLTPLP